METQSLQSDTTPIFRVVSLWNESRINILLHFWQSLQPAAKHILKNQVSPPPADLIPSNSFCNAAAIGLGPCSVKDLSTCSRPLSRMIGSSRYWAVIAGDPFLGLLSWWSEVIFMARRNLAITSLSDNSCVRFMQQYFGTSGGIRTLKNPPSKDGSCANSH